MKLNFRSIENPNDFIIHMPDKMRTIYQIKTQSDYLNFLNNPQKMQRGIIGVYPNNLADKFEEDEKILNSFTS